MPVVTISGQIGSGARDVGRLAAERFQMDYVDQEILVGAAQKLGVPMESVVPFDERRVGLGERLAGLLRRFLEQSAKAGATDPFLGTGSLEGVLGRTYTEAAAESADVSAERYLATLTEIIRELASHDNVLIIGRGSQVILRDRPDALHVLIVAPLEHRVEEYARREGVSEEQASKGVREGDRGRAEFHRKFFNVAVDDPSLYHVTINAARYTPAEAAALIADAARCSLPGAPAGGEPA
ncbi:MAG: cytidylate kinase-like family protein [Dehalococcoidia bacterium]|nr:cytidylate kinase-like family protein [Dehalococcoidia bacterium]